MIARWQRFIVVFIAAAIAAWLAWQWPRSPLAAVLGALVPLAVFLLVMAAEFALMQVANRSDPAGTPRAGAAQVMAAWWAEVRAALAVFGWRQPFRHRCEPDWLPGEGIAAGAHNIPAPAGTGRRGVVLVHGFMCNRGFWGPWLVRLRALGHPFVAVTLEPPLGTIDGYAATIEAAVQRVRAATGGCAPVLLCHSMGGLAARAWLRQYPGADERVHRILTLGTPHGGTWLGRFSRAANGRQMRLGGDWLAQLQQCEPPQRAARLFVCWYSNCDNIVFPASTAALAGADNRFVPGLAHVQMAFDEGVVGECLREMSSD